MSKTAITGIGRSKAPVILHALGADGLVCGTRRSWLEADEFESITATLIETGHVCRRCYPNGIAR